LLDQAVLMVRVTRITLYSDGFADLVM